MKQGFSEGMISLYDIGNVTMLYEPSSSRKVFESLLKNISESENKEFYNQNFNNLKFLMRLSKCVLSNKDERISLSVRIYLSDFIEHNFDFAYSYDWHELKSILFYCNCMSNLKSFENFAANLTNPFINNNLCAYLVKDAAIPERKILALKEQGIDSNENKK